MYSNYVWRFVNMSVKGRVNIKSESASKEYMHICIYVFICVNYPKNPHLA